MTAKQPEPKYHAQHSVSTQPKKAYPQSTKTIYQEHLKSFHIRCFAFCCTRDGAAAGGTATGVS